MSCGRQWHAARPAQLMVARFQPVPDGHPFIKDKAVTAPFALFRRHQFEIFQNAALEVIDLVDAGLPCEGGCLFAAYAAGAEHGDFLAGKLVVTGVQPVRELSK